MWVTRGLLASEAPRLLAHSSSDQLWDADLSGRTAAGLVAYHAAMAEDSPRRMERLLALRDTMMADNLSALADREAHRRPTLVFAHTSTCARGLAGGSWPTWTCAGTLPGPCWPPDSTMPTWSSGRRSAPHHTWRSPNPDVKHPGRLAVHAALRCSSPASGRPGRRDREHRKPSTGLLTVHEAYRCRLHAQQREHPSA